MTQKLTDEQFREFELIAAKALALIAEEIPVMSRKDDLVFGAVSLVIMLQIDALLTSSFKDKDLEAARMYLDNMKSVILSSLSHSGFN